MMACFPHRLLSARGLASRVGFLHRILLTALFSIVSTVTLAAAPSAPPPILTFPANFNSKGLTALLHTEHPRLFATSRDWQRIRQQIPTNAYLTATQNAIRRNADLLLPEPPLERVQTGRRLLLISREVLARVLTLATAYRVTDDPRYLQRAKVELLHVAEFSDWNPSHFLDVAEMTTAMAIGYDWLYHDLSFDERQTIKQAILDKGLRPGSGPAVGINYWKLKDNNWVQVCYGGMVAGALAVAEDEPELATDFLNDMFSHIHQALNGYAPDGVYPEGPGYWSYGTHYSVMLISILQSALGTSWNLDNYPGFQASAVYINEVLGPTRRFFNYSDGDEGAKRDHLMPALHWFATQARNGAIDHRERNLLLTNPERFVGNNWEGRFFPLTLIWLNPATTENGQEQTLPLSWRGNGLNPIATLRSSWDRNGLFVGIKAGRPSNNHGHMDIGSFVLDWKGVRWAFDFGGQDYNSLESLGLKIWGYNDPTSQRWDIFRINNQSHNTLVIDDQPQLINGYAPITRFSDDPQKPFAVMDMSEIYRNSASRAIRGVRLLGNKAVLIHDELSGLGDGSSVRWGMMTEASIDLHDHRAVLHLNGQTLHARIIKPANARFEIISTDPPPQHYDAPNPGTRMLATMVNGNNRQSDIRVVLSDGELSPEDIQKTLNLPPPSQWKTLSSAYSQ